MSRKKENHIVKAGKTVCGFEGDYSKLEHRIKDYCWRIINNNSII